MNKEILLERFIKRDVRVLSGRSLGEAARKELDLDQKDKDDDLYMVIIPLKIYSLNASYFLGLFGPSVRLLKEKFEKKYIFDCSDIIKKNVEDGRSRAIKESNALKNE
jgi:hypothetical protein